MKCNHPKEAPACSFHYNGECLRDHNYECPALTMKNPSNGEMVQIAEENKMTNEKAIDILSEELDHTEFHLKNDNRKAALEAVGGGTWAGFRISNLPSVKPKTGKWVMKWHIFFHTEIPMCSQCSNFSPFKYGYKYCPYCGAEMMEEKTNDEQA